MPALAELMIGLWRREIQETPDEADRRGKTGEF
jgi:hypothetical protein